MKPVSYYLARAARLHQYGTANARRKSRRAMVCAGIRRRMDLATLTLKPATA